MSAFQNFLRALKGSPPRPKADGPTNAAGVAMPTFAEADAEPEMLEVRHPDGRMSQIGRAHV